MSDNRADQRVLFLSGNVFCNRFLLVGRTIKKTILRSVVYVLLVFLGIGKKLFASEIFWIFSKEQVDQEFLRAVGDGNVERVQTLLMAGANPNVHRCNDQKNAFMIAQLSGNSALKSMVMSFGGYLPPTVMDWQLRNNVLDVQDLKQFLTLSASKIRAMGGVIERAEYDYLREIVDIYKKHLNGSAQQQANQNHDGVEQLRRQSS